MGTYGSWALLALSHHYLVRRAARLVSRKSRGLYAVLGDDLLIADEAIAESYFDQAEELGIDISLHKCVAPGVTASGAT